MVLRVSRLVATLAVATSGLLGGVIGAHAAPVTIIGYDVSNANVSGFGGWQHSYSGAIDVLGEGIANYSGGTGTMADGIIGDSLWNTQLFHTSAGASITLFLDDYYTINTIESYGGPTNNGIPGQLSGFDLEIASTGVSFLTEPFGELNGVGDPVNDRVSLAGTALEGLVTDRITISNILALQSGSWPGYFSINEIKLDGTSSISAVAIPAALPLFLAGLASLGVFGWRKNRRVPQA